MLRTLVSYFARGNSNGSFGSKGKWRKIVGIGIFPVVILFMFLVQRNEARKNEGNKEIFL